MKNLHTKEQIEEMRNRLYDRGSEVNKTIKHKLSDDPVEVSKDWSSGKTVSAKKTDLRVGAEVAPSEPLQTEPVEEKPKRHYRSFVLLGSLLIFVFVAGISSLFLYFGGNQISNENIQIAVQGPSLIGGGEVVPLQVTVTNQNSVAIESATLILKYPEGTRSVGDSPRNLFEERISLDDIAPGEVKNIPVRVAIFGEENSEKNVEATIEYRVNGSNGMFYKDADSLAVRISSSPLVLRIDAIEKVASGQLVDITMTAVSNASSPLYDVLVTASYPNGFSYETSDPEPVYGQNVWRIDELLPEQSETIELKGIVTGLTEETFVINFDAGPANLDNQYIVGAVLAEADVDFVIERPFLNVVIDIGSGGSKDVIIPQGQVTQVAVDITNTLDETIYDMVVEVVPGGNALDIDSISGKQGFYDSNTGTVRWEVSNNANFDRVFPGDKRSLQFGVSPNDNYTTASFDLVVNVYARRVAESSALETLVGTVRAEAKYSSVVTLGSQAGRVSGPVPPKVGETTTYKLSLVAEAGANDITNAIVETSLPLHVNWLDSYDADGDITYNSVSKKIQWAIGDISSGQRKEFDFNVNILPSVSQVGEAPVLLNTQLMKANDRFTGSLLQDEALAVTTELSEEMGYERENGLVER